MTHHSPEWLTEYQPYTGQDGQEIPCYRIYDQDANLICETSEDAPDRVQAANHRSAIMAPVDTVLLCELSGFWRNFGEAVATLRR